MMPTEKFPMCSHIHINVYIQNRKRKFLVFFTAASDPDKNI